MCSKRLPHIPFPLWCCRSCIMCINARHIARDDWASVCIIGNTTIYHITCFHRRNFPRRVTDDRIAAFVYRNRWFSRIYRNPSFYDARASICWWYLLSAPTIHKCVCVCMCTLCVSDQSDLKRKLNRWKNINARAQGKPPSRRLAFTIGMCVCLWVSLIQALWLKKIKHTRTTSLI